MHDFIVDAGKVNFGTCESSSGQEHVASLSPGSGSNSSTSFVGEKYAGSSSASLSVPTQQTQLAVMGLDDESVIAPVESLPEVSRKILFLLFAINVEAPSVCSQGFYVKFYLQLKSH